MANFLKKALFALPEVREDQQRQKQNALANRLNEQSIAANENTLQQSKRQASQEDVIAIGTAALNMTPDEIAQNYDTILGTVKKLGVRLDPDDEIRTPQNIQGMVNAANFVRNQRLAKTSVPGAVVEFDQIAKRGELSPEDKVKAARIKAGLDPRAQGSSILTIANQGLSDKVAEAEQTIAAGKETGKLKSQLKLKPEVEAAVVSAVKVAESASDIKSEQRSNSIALNVYDTAMSGLVSSLGGTITGPIAGWIPAISSNQQIADGAVAAMAPVLKQLFRSAGEGTFTDHDQKVLMDMVPTRKDTPKARVAKMQMIDAIVRAKLNQTPSAAGNEGGSSVVMSHPVYGEITEDDIKTTMQENGLTRQQVMDQLSGGQ